MKKFLIWFITLFLSLALFSVAQAANLKGENDLAKYFNKEVLTLDKTGNYQIWTYSEVDQLAEALQKFSQDEQIIWYQPNYVYTSTVNDLHYAKQWGLKNNGSFIFKEEQFPFYEDPFGSISNDFGSSKAVQGNSGVDINIEAAWDNYNGGTRETIIALIDTGVDYTHEDLENALWTNKDEIPGNGLDDDQNGYIDDYYGWNFYNNSNQIYTNPVEDRHGTHCAGSMVAVTNNTSGIAGIAGNSAVKVMALKALGGSDGSGSTDSVIKAIQYAEANGAVICNLSLGANESDQALYQAIADSSMLFVIASGNGDEWTGQGQNLDVFPWYPSSYSLDNIIAVANLQPNGRLHYSSNYGSQSVDLAAPGTYILSTIPGNKYGYMTGTSMSAPVVSAVAALVYSQNDQLTLPEVKDIILTSVHTNDSLKGKLVSGGFLDAGAAVRVATSYSSSDASRTNWSQTFQKLPEGSAPVINFFISRQNGEDYLVVEVKDADRDLNLLRFISGRWDASYFDRGESGTAFELDENNQTWFHIDLCGAFTFYALDQAGHETVKTVTLDMAPDGRIPLSDNLELPEEFNEYQGVFEYMTDYINNFLRGFWF